MINQLRGMNEILNIIATEVKADREYKEAVSELFDELHDQLNDFKNNPFGTK